MRQALIKYNLIWVLLLAIFFSGAATLVLSMESFYASSKDQHQFSGDSQVIHYPGLDWQHFKSHEFQQYVEALVSKKLRLRNLYIHVNNQLYYSLFKKSFADDGGVIIGKNKQLYQSNYIHSYCDRQMSSEQLRDWADKLKHLQNFFAARKITFLYLITPSKAEYLPEQIPDRFHCQAHGLNPQLVELQALLKARSLRFVNSPAIMEQARSQYTLPLFPQGGTHWNWLGAALATQAILTQLKLPTLRFDYSLESPKGQDMDSDLIDLMKLMKPDLKYQVPQLHFSALKAPAKLKISIIGGSFNESIIKILEKYKAFSQIRFYYYFKSQRSFVEGQKDPVDLKFDPSSKGVRDAILDSDVVILEENSSLIARSEHAREFYQSIRS